MDELTLGCKRKTRVCNPKTRARTASNIKIWKMRMVKQAYNTGGL